MDVRATDPAYASATSGGYYDSARQAGDAGSAQAEQGETEAQRRDNALQEGREALPKEQTDPSLVYSYGSQAPPRDDPSLQVADRPQDYYDRSSDPALQGIDYATPPDRSDPALAAADNPPPIDRTADPILMNADNPASKYVYDDPSLQAGRNGTRGSYLLGAVVNRYA